MYSGVHPPLDDVAHGIGRAMQFFLGDGIWLPAAFRPKLNYHVIFVSQVFEFFVICDMIGGLHSDCPFRVDLFLQIDSNTEVLAMDLLFS